MRTLLRTALRVLLALVVVSAAALFVLQRTNPKPAEARGWTQLAPMPQARGEVAAAAADGKLYVVGGLRGFTRTEDAVGIYDIEADSWTTAPYAVPKRHHAAATTYNGRVYVTGGASAATDWTPSDGAFVLHDRSLGRLPPMREGRQGHAMATVGDRIYVVGGVGPTDDTMIYNPVSKRWSRGAELPQGRDHLRAVGWRGKVWTIGGRAGDVLDRVDIYDPRRDRWTDGPNLPEPMSAMSVGVIDDTLHVIGGEHPNLFGGKVIASHYSLERGAKRWRKEGRVMLPVHGAGYGVHGGSLYVVGGASRQGALSTISWTATTQTFTP